MWCDLSLSYHEAWAQMSGLFHKLRRKTAFRCIMLIPDSAPHAVYI